MSNAEMIALAAAGVALWFMFGRKAAAAVPVSASSGIYPKEIFNQALPGDAAYGWRYFSDGTVIDPNGAYWQDNRILWAPGL